MMQAKSLSRCCRSCLVTITASLCCPCAAEALTSGSSFPPSAHLLMISFNISLVFTFSFLLPPLLLPSPSPLLFSHLFLVSLTLIRSCLPASLRLTSPRRLTDSPGKWEERPAPSPLLVSPSSLERVRVSFDTLTPAVEERVCPRASLTLQCNGANDMLRYTDC